MIYYSLNHQSPNVSFAEAAVKGQAPDKGLYFPERIPTLSKEFIQNIRNYSKEEIGFTVMKPYVGESIPDDVLKQYNLAYTEKELKECVSFNKT